MSNEIEINSERQIGVIFAGVADNCIEHGVRGILEHKDIQRMINEYDDEDKQARIYGKFQHLIGLIFKQFTPKIHVIKPFKINSRDFVVINALDPHPRNPDAVQWMAIDKNGTKFIINELYGSYKTAELVEKIKSKETDYRIELRIADPAAFVEDKHATNSAKNTLAAQLDQLGLRYQKATKDRTRANRRIGDALSFDQKGEQLLYPPELYIFDTCARTIWEFEHYQWDDWRGRAAERKDPMEKPMDKDDHMMENLGRMLVQEASWFPPDPIRTIRASESPAKRLDPFD